MRMSSDLAFPKLRAELALSPQLMQSDRRTEGKKNKEELRPLCKISLDFLIVKIRVARTKCTMKNETILLNSLFVVTSCGNLCTCTDRFKKLVCKL